MNRLENIRLFMLDMDGTIYLGDRLFPCTIPFLMRLKEKGIEYLFVTNNSSKDKKDYLEKLERLNIPANENNLLTSGDVTIEFIKDKYPDKTVYLVGTKALKRSFTEEGLILVDYSKADITVVGFDTELNYEKLNGIYQNVMDGKPYICTHPDMVCPTEYGFIPDIGATIAYIEALTQKRPDYIIGKPYEYMPDAASLRFGIKKEEIAMAGDRLYTDIEMAIRAGITSILVLSGETTQETLSESDINPDYVLNDLSEITKQI